MTKKTNRKHSQSSDALPQISYSLNLRVTAAQLKALSEEPSVVIVRLEKPVERNGEKFDWFVHAFQLTPDGKPIELSKQIFCRNETEADREQKRLLAEFKKEKEDRERKERERPLPGVVLKVVRLIRGRSLRMDAIPISLLPHVTGTSIPASELPADKPFIDVGHAYFKGADGSGQAALSIIRETHEFVQVIRLIRYDSKVEQSGIQSSIGVEFAECDLELNALRVMNRWLCLAEKQGHELLKEKEREIRARIQTKQGKTEREHRMAEQIRQIQVLADKALDSKAKAAHLRRIAAIRAEQQALGADRAKAEAEQARIQNEQHSAFGKLIRENFPEVSKVKAQMKGCLPEEMPRWKEQLRRAMRIDSARLGIVSPFNDFSLDGALAKEVAKAMDAKSPVKPDQIAAVLNWMAKGYDSMREEDWTADVSKQIKRPVNKAGLKRTISKKFGLKSKLKGRTERSPKNRTD
jgi:hypothetical protein